MCNGSVAGTEDHTACFHCWDTLKDWQETENAWQEHTRCFPRSFYVIHVKGITLILENIEALKTTQDF